MFLRNKKNFSFWWSFEQYKRIWSQRNFCYFQWFWKVSLSHRALMDRDRKFREKYLKLAFLCSVEVWKFVSFLGHFGSFLAKKNKNDKNTHPKHPKITNFVKISNWAWLLNFYRMKLLLCSLESPNMVIFVRAQPRYEQNTLISTESKNFGPKMHFRPF